MNQYFNAGKFGEALYKLIPYFPLTLRVVFLSLLFAVIGGLLLTFLRFRKNRFISKLSSFITSLIRGTPLIILLFIIYYGAPVLFKQIGVAVDIRNPVRFAIITFSISLSAFISEIMKAAYMSIDRGQLEAAQSIGIPGWRLWCRILIPQTLIIQLPNIGSLIITAVKQSSIMFTIGILDIYQKANSMSANNSGIWQLEIFTALMCIYWIAAIIVDKSFGLIYRFQKIKLG